MDTAAARPDTPGRHSDAASAPHATLQFLGAAGTVTGSMHLVRTGGRQILLDCGLFQGRKALRLRNWQERIAHPSAIDAVVVSHAHLDHSGYLPLLVRQGFSGPIYCTPATGDLLRVLLPDAGHLQEEEAERANRYGYSKHHPALPLYTVRDAHAALELIEHRSYDHPFPVSPGIAAVLRHAGHILGAATVELQIGAARMVYSGDLGRWNRPILRDPEFVSAADLLVLESTYGNRLHAGGGAEELERVVRDAARRGGALLIPAFAVDRTQEILWLLDQLEHQHRIPSLPVYLDSPLAIEATEVYARHPEEYDRAMRHRAATATSPFSSHHYHFARTPEESKALNSIHGPVIVISASGMATGGRILHHLALRLPDPRTTVLLAGFQAAETRGRRLLEGAREVKMLGHMVSVRATIESIDALSAHADREEILRWLSGFRHPPAETYLVHGEPAAAAALATTIRERLGWRVNVADDGAVVPVRRA